MGETIQIDDTDKEYLLEQVQKAISDFQENQFEHRLDCKKLKEPFADIGSAINSLLQAMADKATWYESILDSIQFPITVTDMDSLWTFVNKAVEDFLKVSRKDIIGKPCSDWNAGICNTENCGIRRLRNGFSTTTFEQFGGHFQVDTAYVKNFQGDNIGHVEVVQDITPLVKMKNELADKAAWYESILDAVPFPITVTDMDSRWTFVNKSVEKMLNVNRRDLFGHLCSEWGAGICNTENCGIKRLRSGFSNTKFDQFGGHFNVDCAYVTNSNNERVGHVEVVTDITEVVKVSKYLRTEVDHVAENLKKLAAGDLNLNYEVGAADDHTREASELFVLVNTSLKEATNALSLMLDDVLMLSEVAKTGKLSTRADVSKHYGEFKQIVIGVNETLDSVIIPIKEAIRVSTEFARYNFKARVNPNLTFAGDWVEFKDDLNNVGIQISEAFSLIERKLVDLTANAEEASANIQEIANGSNRIAINANQVSVNATQGEEGIEQILRAMDDLNTTVGSVAQRAEQVSGTAVRASEISRSGMDLAEQTEKAMISITTSTDEVSTIFLDINGQMREIGKIVKVISDIASQTNLLALNAAIEAARAGDAGRGFAVVASEVKSLAEDSRKSAGNIADMITNLQKKSEDAQIAIGRAGDTVSVGEKSLQETLKSFEEIEKTIQEISSKAMDVASASEEQAASVQEVTASIGEVAAYIKNTSGEAISATQAAEQASVAVDQITNVMVNLNNIADAVTREVKKFLV